MKNLRKFRKLHIVVFTLLGAFATTSATSVARAQLAPATAATSGTLANSGAAATTPPPKPASDEIVEMNPFVVSTTQDRGYAARDTLVGSRLKTDLRDIAAPTSAFTQEFLDDLSVNDVDSIAPYMLSTDFENQESVNANQNNAGTSVARTLRIRGLPASKMIDFFSMDYPADRFSTERFDQARGPNGILFGLGNPGGIVNSTTKRAMVNKEQGYLRLIGSSYDGLRTELDFNQPIVTNTLAVRVAAVKTNQETWRDNEHNDQNRIFGTLQWKIGRKTELNIMGERGSLNVLSARNVIGTDGLTPWINAGSNLSSTANAALGIALQNSNQITLNTADGTISNLQNTTRGASAAAATGELLPVTNFNLIPRETTFYGPGFGVKHNYSRVAFNLTQQFTKDWYLDIYGVHLNADNNATDSNGLGTPARDITVDTNPTLPNGQPNPNAGSPYLDYYPQINHTILSTNAIRAMMTYTKDLGWAGRHTLAILGEYSENNTNQVVLREQIISPNAPNPNAMTNVGNIVYRRTYVDLNGPSDNIRDADWTQPGQGFNGRTDPATGRTYISAWVPFNNNTQINSTRGTRASAVLQSSFWSGRIATTLGASYDARYDYRSTTAQDPYMLQSLYWQSYNQARQSPTGHSTGFIYYNGYNSDSLPFVFDTNTSSWFAGAGISKPVRSYTASPINAKSYAGGIVFHVTDWISLTYNRSQNGGLPNSAGFVWSADGSIQGQRPPSPSGRSDDAGIKLELLKSRLFATITWFRTIAKNDSNNEAPDAAGVINPIWSTFESPNAAAVAQGFQPPTIQELGYSQWSDLTDATTYNTFDTQTKGIEAEITANPTDNLRIYLNYSHTLSTQTNIGTAYIAYVNRWLPLFESAAQYPLNGTTGATIGEQVQLLENTIAEQYTMAEGRETIGQVRHRGNLIINYDFSTGILRGFSVGTTFRYTSKPVAGYWVSAQKDGDGNYVLDDSGNPVKIVDEFWGHAQLMVDFRIAYRRKIALLGKSLMWSVQLNVNNIFNNDDVAPQRIVADGSITMYKFMDPRAFSVTTMLRF